MKKSVRNVKKVKTKRISFDKRNFIIILGCLLFSIAVLAFIGHYINGKAIDLTNPQDPLGIGIGPQDVNQDTLTNKAQDEWSYLQQEWQKILLQNPLISAMNYVFTQLSFMFVILFGESYSLSFLLFFSIFLWMMLVIILKHFIKGSFGIRGDLSYLIAIGIAILIAQFKIIKWIAESILAFGFSPDDWLYRLLAWIAIITIVAVIVSISKQFEKYSKFVKKKQEEEKGRKALKKVEKFAESAGI